MKLSVTMQKALDFANQHGGKLVRYPGGFWMQEGFKTDNHTWMNRRWFGTSTVQALVARQEMWYSRWQTGRNGEFPIEATVRQPSSPTRARIRSNYKQ